MTHYFKSAATPVIGVLLLAGFSLAGVDARAATIIAPNDPPDLSGPPPDLSQSVDPNIMVTFDDSGSMTSNFMGDNRPFDLAGWGGNKPVTNPWFCAGVIDPRDTTGSVLSKAMNGVYYNPNVLYTPPLKQDGNPFPDADKTLAAVWADGIAINRPASFVNPNAAAYNNNPQSAQNASDQSVTIINGKLVTTSQNQTQNEKCGGTGNPKCNPTTAGNTCGPIVNTGATVSSCSCSGSGNSKTCTWKETFVTNTVTDNRWICGSTTGSPTNGANPQYPAAFAGGEDVTNGGPYYYRLIKNTTIAVDAYGNPTSVGQSALYKASNWEAVAITNTNVTISGKTVNQWQNFANWYAYYRTRNLMTRTALSRVFGVIGDNIRVAWQNISPYDPKTTTQSGAVAITSSTIITNLNNSQTGTAANYRTNFFNWIFQTKAYSNTPDRAATIKAGEFFKGNKKDLTDPYYDPGVGADLGCRQNFHMLVTDGFWNEDDPTLPAGPTFFTAASGPPGGTLPANAGSGATTTPYSTSDTQTRVYWDTQGTAYKSSLANIGYYYWATDLRPDLGPQTPPQAYHSPVPTYVKDSTVGVTTASGASADAQKEEIYFNPANDPADWRHVVQFMVTLGVAGKLQYSNDVDCTNKPNDLCALRQGQANSTTKTGWTTPANNSPPGIDDTWHAAVNSRGSYFSASNPADLVSHLTDIIDSIIARSGQSSAESVSTSILNQGALGYQGGYNSSGWTGYLYQQNLDPATGVAGKINWDAGCILTGGLCAATNVNVGAATDPTKRIIITSVGTAGSLTGKPFEWASLGTAESNALSLDPTTTHPDLTTTLVPVANGTTDVNGLYRLAYLRGDRSYESSTTPTTKPVKFRPRSSVLGAIINSQTTYEGGPSSGWLDIYPVGSPEQAAANAGNTYGKFVSTNLTRQPMIYVGANDGMLHAFAASKAGVPKDGGSEVWAYVPHTLYSNGQLDQLTNSVNNLVTTVDDTPIVGDVFTGGKWRTMLVGSLRLGGRGIYALDVTDSSAPKDEATAAGKFMWEFSSEQDSDLGYTYASANVARIRCNVAPCSGVGTTGTATPGGTWVVLVSGGYFPKTLPGQTNGSGATDAAAGVTKTTSYLWVLNASDGSVIKKIPTKTGITSFGMSTPVTVDFGLDQLVELAVAGDLAGNLWRFDISDPDPGNWKVDDLFQTYTSTAACGSTNKHGIGCEPISVMPIPFPDSQTGRVIYVFGTGEYLGASDRTSTSVYTPQHFFGVRDFGTGFAKYPFTENDLDTQTLTQDNTTNLRSLTFAPTPSTNTPSRGWQIPLNVTGINGERDVTTAVPLFSSGIAILVSLIPGTNNDPCNPGRLGAVLAVNANNGGPPFSDPDSDATTGTAGSLVSNPPATGGASAISLLGGGTVVLPGMGGSGSPINPPCTGKDCPPPCTKDCPPPCTGNDCPPPALGFTPVWRRTSWNELLNNL